MMSKNIQKIIHTYMSNPVSICYLTVEWSLFSISKSTFHYRQPICLHLQRLLKCSNSQRHDLNENKAIRSGNSRMALELMEPNVLKMNLSKIYQRCSSVMNIHTKCSMQAKSPRQTLPKNEEKKEELEEVWGGPDAFKLIVFLKDDFDEVIKRHKAVLVFFSANWCPHCLKLRKPYGRTAVMAKQANLDVVFATFDVNYNPEIADAMGVVGIPTLKYYQDGKFFATYRGPRTSDGLFEFVKQPQRFSRGGKKADV